MHIIQCFLDFSNKCKFKYDPKHVYTKYREIVPRQWFPIYHNYPRHIMYIHFIHLFIEFIKPVYSTCTYLYNNYVKIIIIRISNPLFTSRRYKGTRFTITIYS